MVCPAGRVSCTAQPARGADPLLVTVTVTWKPPGQVLITWYAAAHPPVPLAVVGGAVVGGRVEGGAVDGGAVDGGAVDGGAVDGGRVEGGAVEGGGGSLVPLYGTPPARALRTAL